MKKFDKADIEGGATRSLLRDTGLGRLILADRLEKRRFHIRKSSDKSLDPPHDNEWSRGYHEVPFSYWNSARLSLDESGPAVPLSLIWPNTSKFGELPGDTELGPPNRPWYMRDIDGDTQVNMAEAMERRPEDLNEPLYTSGMIPWRIGCVFDSLNFFLPSHVRFETV